MTIDQLTNWDLYCSGEPWSTAFEFLLSLDQSSAEQRHDLSGDLIYASVEGYDTIPYSATLPESHREYLDIQSVLAGRERIGWWPSGSLDVLKPYAADRDIAFHDRPADIAATLDLAPGSFAVFHPGEIHMPSLHPGDTPTRVKKVVVKVHVSLL